MCCAKLKSKLFAFKVLIIVTNKIHNIDWVFVLDVEQSKLFLLRCDFFVTISLCLLNLH